jgi:hypothetical protein
MEFVQFYFTQWFDSLPVSAAAFVSSLWTTQFPCDWTNIRMPPWIAWLLFSIDVGTWLFYVIEKDVAVEKHIKFRAKGLWMFLVVHILSGMLETVVGFFGILHPEYPHLATIAAWTALVAHIPTNLLLSPYVWGLKYITVTGYVIVGLLRAYTAIRVLENPLLLPELWILLQMAGYIGKGKEWHISLLRGLLRVENTQISQQSRMCTL